MWKFVQIVSFIQIILAQHVWHVLNVNTQTRCEINHVYENNSYFVDDKNETVTNFTTNTNYKFGLILNPLADFNMIYSLSCMNINCKQSPCPRCVFILSADAPASPNITIINYQQSYGNWSVNNNVILLTVTF